jgi:hypothetical protein
MPFQRKSSRSEQVAVLLNLNSICFGRWEGECGLVSGYGMDVYTYLGQGIAALEGAVMV